MADYYNRRGEPMTMEEWAVGFEESDRKVARTHINDIQISTVWLGLDHNYGANGPPLIFETMIFGGPYDEYQARYSTEKEALAGHVKAVALVERAERGIAARFRRLLRRASQ